MNSAASKPQFIVLGARDPETGKWLRTDDQLPAKAGREDWKGKFMQLKEVYETILQNLAKERVEEFVGLNQLWVDREDEFAHQLNEKTVENMNLEAKLQRKAEENAFLEAEVVEKSNQIRGLTAELADAKKALVSREQAEEAREHWWLYKAFEKDAKGGEANVGPDASGMEVLGEAKEVGTNKQIEDKQTKKCGKCQQMLNNHKDLKSHMKHCGEKKKIECKECGYQARIPFFLAKHMERKHLANIFSCDKCMFTSTSEYWFKKHAKAHNGKGVNCDVCKKYFSSTRNLKAHKDGVHGLPKL